MKTIFLTIFFSFSLFAEEGIPVVGLDGEGHEMITSISSKKYQELLDYEINKSTDLLANRMDQNLLIIGDRILHLDGILVGMGASGEIGLGPFKLGAGVNQQFYFRNND
jgi:hypothetical protein